MLQVLTHEECQARKFWAIRSYILCIDGKGFTGTCHGKYLNEACDQNLINLRTFGPK